MIEAKLKENIVSRRSNEMVNFWLSVSAGGMQVVWWLSPLTIAHGQSCIGQPLANPHISARRRIPAWPRRQGRLVSEGKNGGE